MSNLSIFLNAKIENSGILAAIGDFGLAPVRYLFNGNDVEITIENSEVIEVGHGPSFEVEPSLPLRMLKAAAAIILLVPGLLLSVAKLAAYLSKDVRDAHEYAKRRFTPVDRELKLTAEKNSKLINNEQELKKAAKQLKNEIESSDSFYQPTGILRIYLSKAGREDLSDEAINIACEKLNARQVVVIEEGNFVVD